MRATDGALVNTVYVDTSAWVALFANESGAAGVRQWMLGHQESVLCSAQWCVTEFASALSVKVRYGGISQAQADAAWAEFEQLCDGGVKLLPVETQDFSTAAMLCRVTQSAMRSGDALHLAVALRSRCKNLISLDKNLNLNARANDLNVVALV